MSARDDDTSARDAALLGGGALLTYFLLRRFGSGGGGGHVAGGGQPSVATSTAPARPNCDVFLRGTALELDGATSTLAAAIAACRASGGAHIRASGDTRQGALDDLIRALLDAGVTRFGPSERLDDVNRVRAAMTERRS